MYKNFGPVDDELAARMFDFLQSATIRLVQKYQSTEGSTASWSPSSTPDIIDPCTEHLGDLAQLGFSRPKTPVSFDRNVILHDEVLPPGPPELLSQLPYAKRGYFFDQFTVSQPYSMSEEDPVLGPFSDASPPFTYTQHMCHES